MNRFRKNKSSRRGFTLVEILIAVGIVAILTAIAIPTISAISKSLHQKQLDDYAQSVYLAAQDHLVSLRRNGTITKFEATVSEGVELYPTVLKQEKNANFPSAEVEENKGAMEYAFITSYSDLLPNVLPEDSIDATVRNSYNYLIEFNRYTGDVYSVFLSDDPSVIMNDAEGKDPYENLTAWCGEENNIRENHRLRRQHLVGYYQGELVASGEVIHKEGTYGAFVELTNGQEFLVNVYVPIPENMQGSSTFKNSIKNITLSITGLSSGTTITYDMMEDKYKAVETDVKNNTGAVVEYCYSMPLQSLVNERNFGLEGQGFIPGENVSISARVNSTAIDIEDSNLVDGNPWFQSYESALGNVWISNGRHLQNLERLNNYAGSSDELYVSEITLSNTIDWLSTKAYYAEPSNVGGRAYNMNFSPVENQLFVKNTEILFNGKESSIENLYIDDYENDVTNTGLFRVYNAKVSKLTILNPTVRGSKSADANVGAFAGVLENSADLEAVQVRINKAENPYANYATTPDWTGVCGLGNTGLLAGYNKGIVNQLVVSTSLKGGYYGVPVSGTSYGLVSGVNEGTVSLSSFLGVLKAGSAYYLGGVTGQNVGTVQVTGSYDLTVGSAAAPVGTDVFGGVAGSSSGILEAAGEIYLNASFQDTKTDTSSNGTSSPFIYGGVVGSMSGGSVTGFTVCLERDRGIAYTVSVSNRSANVGGIVGRLTGSAKFYDEKDKLLHLALDDFSLAVNTSSAYGEAFVGGLAGYSAVPVTNATLSLSKTNIEVSAGSSNAYVGGMFGMNTSTLSNVSLNSIGKTTNKIQVKSFVTAFVGGISGGLGTSMTNGWLLTLENAMLSINVGNGNKSGTAFVGGLIGEGEYSSGETLGRGTVASCLIKVDSGATKSDATSLKLDVSASKAVVGGLVAQLNSSAEAIGTVKNCSTQGVAIDVSGNAVYAGGAVGICNGSIGGADEADAVSLDGTLTLKTAATTKYAGGAVGMEAGSSVKKTYQHVKAAVSLSGWSKGTAGSVYEDPSQMGVNVGQFIGYVKDGTFKNCSSTLASGLVSGSYQFLGKIFCGEQSAADTTKYFVTYAEPSAEVRKAMVEPVSDYESINALAAHYGLQLADSIAKHEYQATLENCTYISEGEIYDQFINTEQKTWRYSGHSDFGHYRFVPLEVDINGLYAPNLFSGYKIDNEVEIFLYDKVNGNLLYSPDQDLNGLTDVVKVTGRKVSQTEIDNGIIYLNEDEDNLLSYRWSIMARQKYIINPDIIDSSTLRVSLFDRGKSCMVPFLNSSQGIYFFNPLGSNIDILHLFNDEYNVPEMLTLDKQSDGSYVICQRSYYPDRIVYNKEGNYYYSSRTYSNENTRFQLLAYTPLSKDVNSQGWYFTPEGNDTDQICTYAKHTAE